MGMKSSARRAYNPVLDAGIDINAMFDEPGSGESAEPEAAAQLSDGAGVAAPVKLESPPVEVSERGGTAVSPLDSPRGLIASVLAKTLESVRDADAVVVADSIADAVVEAERPKEAAWDARVVGRVDAGAVVQRALGEGYAGGDGADEDGVDEDGGDNTSFYDDVSGVSTEPGGVGTGVVAGAVEEARAGVTTARTNRTRRGKKDQHDLLADEVELTVGAAPACGRYLWHIEERVFKAADIERQERMIPTWGEYFIAVLAQHARELETVFPSLGYDLSVFGIGPVARRGYRRGGVATSVAAVYLPKNDQGRRIAEVIETYAARARSKSVFAQTLLEHHLKAVGRSW